MEMNYDCVFNDLPEWMKVTIFVEACLLNLMLLSAIIVVIYCKIKMKNEPTD